MSLELLGIVLNACLTGIIAIYIIWDHVKDDRFLAKKVQEFYENIENSIFPMWRHFFSFRLRQKN